MNRGSIPGKGTGRRIIFSKALGLDLKPIQRIGLSVPGTDGQVLNGQGS
jgi:hypothetical protein